MPYGQFTMETVKSKLGLTVGQVPDLFADVPEADVPAALSATLARYLPVARNLNTEKGRSELLIAPVLVELYLLHKGRMSLFSGVEMNVDDALGLRGWCDFVISRDPGPLQLTALACVLVEAKNLDMVAGIPQCLAEMVAARKFNLGAAGRTNPCSAR